MLHQVNMIHTIATHSYSVYYRIDSYPYNSTIPLRYVNKYSIMCVIAVPIHYWSTCILTSTHKWCCSHSPLLSEYNSFLPLSICEVLLIHPCVCNRLYTYILTILLHILNDIQLFELLFHWFGTVLIERLLLVKLLVGIILNTTFGFTISSIF